MKYIINGRILSGFTILTEPKSEQQALYLAELLAKRLDVHLPVMPSTCFGEGDVLCFSADCNSYGGFRYALRTREDNGSCRITLEGETVALQLLAAEEFARRCEKGSSILPAVLFGYDWEKLRGIPLELTQVSAKTALSGGVTYHNRTYTRPDGQPVKAYFLTVPFGSAEIAAEAAPYGKAATVPAIAEKAVRRKRKKILAAVNADFFSLPSDGAFPCGMQIVDGKVQQEPQQTERIGYNWFGITNECLPVISNGSAYAEKYQEKLKSAVGGSIRLMIDGQIVPPEETTLEPRTYVGITSDHTVVLACIDGRQPELSVGADYVNQIQLMADLDLDLKEILNLDGGGSSVMVMKNEDGIFQPVNSPCEIPLRPVVNALTVVEKKTKRS